MDDLKGGLSEGEFALLRFKAGEEDGRWVDHGLTQEAEDAATRKLLERGMLTPTGATIPTGGAPQAILVATAEGKNLIRLWQKAQAD